MAADSASGNALISFTELKPQKIMLICKLLICSWNWKIIIIVIIIIFVFYVMISNLMICHWIHHSILADGKQKWGVSASDVVYHFGTSGISVAAATGITHPLGFSLFFYLIRHSCFFVG